jgi:hypothetical protein
MKIPAFLICAVKIISQLYMVNPYEQERFALRPILLHAKGARSFEELRTVNGHRHNTFMEAAQAMNLLHNAEEYRLTLNEAKEIAMPKGLRELFVTIIVYCMPEDPLVLWNEFKGYFSEDFSRRFRDEVSQEDCELMALCRIHDLIATYRSNPDAPREQSDSASALPIVDLETRQGLDVTIKRLDARYSLSDNVLIDPHDKRIIAEQRIQQLNEAQGIVFERVKHQVNCRSSNSSA